MAGLVRSQATRAATRRAADLGTRIEFLAFSVAGEVYAVPISQVAEILKPPPITEVPRAPRSILGVVSVRGRLVTVIDLRRRLKLTESPLDRRTRILLTPSDRGEPMGLLVDEVLQVYRMAENEIEPANVLGGDHAPHIAGIGRPERALLILLDLHSILAG
jgi:purine-binding chemotaxis protein CheW